jgi:hypothetical protein
MGVARTLEEVENYIFKNSEFIVRFDKLESLINDTYSKICEALKVINNNQSFYKVVFYLDFALDDWGACSMWIEKSLLGKRRTNIRYSLSVPGFSVSNDKVVIVGLFYKRKHSKIPIYLERMGRFLNSYDLHLDGDRIVIPLKPDTIDILKFLV